MEKFMNPTFMVQIPLQGDMAYGGNILLALERIVEVIRKDYDSEHPVIFQDDKCILTQGNSVLAEFGWFSDLEIQHTGEVFKGPRWSFTPLPDGEEVLDAPEVPWALGHTTLEAQKKQDLKERISCEQPLWSPGGGV